MSKGIFFTGQPIFAQVLSYVSRARVFSIASDFQADRYCKGCGTYEHLVTLLYGIFNRCSSIREVVTGLLAWEQRIKHLKMNYQPRRSTLGDANNRRPAEVFERIYYDLYGKYSGFLPDSRSKKRRKKLFIVDSTTISLFQEILRNVGMSPFNGKRKGGIKVHMLIDTDRDVPSLVNMTPAVASDNPFLSNIDLPKGSILIMDRGYMLGYSELNRMSRQQVTWISRLRVSTAFRTIEENQITPFQKQQGVLLDQKILMGHEYKKNSKKVKARLVRFKDPETGRIFDFVTNNQRLTSTQIANYYKRRWQIETLFKRLKQNFPLNRFLGESENAIKIQIWCVLIADLILKVIKSAAAKSWSFSNLASIIRLHLMTYIDLFTFLKNPDKALVKQQKGESQIALFSP